MEGGEDWGASPRLEIALGLGGGGAHFLHSVSPSTLNGEVGMGSFASSTVCLPLPLMKVGGGGGGGGGGGFLTCIICSVSLYL